MTTMDGTVSIGGYLRGNLGGPAGPKAELAGAATKGARLHVPYDRSKEIPTYIVLACTAVPSPLSTDVAKWRAKNREPPDVCRVMQPPKTADAQKAAAVGIRSALVVVAGRIPTIAGGSRDCV